MSDFYFGHRKRTIDEYNGYLNGDSRTTQMRPAENDPCQFWKIDIMRPLEYSTGKANPKGVHIVSASIHGTKDPNDLLRFQQQLAVAEKMVRDEKASRTEQNNETTATNPS